MTQTTTTKGTIKIINEEALELLSKDMKTLEERIGNNTINLYNYNKHDKKQPGRNTITGKALLNNKIKNLSVIDIDINKSLDNDTKDKIRNNILSKLSDDDVIVKTASGGLIYILILMILLPIIIEWLNVINLMNLILISLILLMKTNVL